MALGTLATIALGVSAASGIASAAGARSARKDQTRQLEQQQVEAREAARLRDVREGTGAEIALGSDTESSSGRRRKVGNAKAPTRSSSPVPMSTFFGLNAQRTPAPAEKAPTFFGIGVQRSRPAAKKASTPFGFSSVHRKVGL